MFLALLTGPSIVKVPVLGAPSRPTHWLRIKAPKLSTSLDPAYPGFTT